MTWHGEPVVDIPPGSAADGPVYHRPWPAPGLQDALAAPAAGRAAPPGDVAGLRADLLALLGSEGLADKSWVTDQYDRYVRGDTVLAMPEDGGLIRVDEATGLGIALATDGNGRYCRPRPLPGHPAGAIRGLPERGGDRGAPAGRDELPEFRLAGGPRGDVAVLRGRAPGWRTAVPRRRPRAYRSPAGTSASTTRRGRGHPPHPGDRGVGVHDDVRLRLSIGFGAEGEDIVVLGRTGEEFGGSAWAHVLAGHLGGRPPAPDLDAERRLAALLAAAAAAGLLSPRTTCPTEDWPSPSPSRACAAAAAARYGCPATRSPLCSASRRAAPSWRSGRVRRPVLWQLRDAHGVPGRAHRNRRW